MLYILYMHPSLYWLDVRWCLISFVCVLQVFLCALVSRPVCARTRAQLRGNIVKDAVIIIIANKTLQLQTLQILKHYGFTPLQWFLCCFQKLQPHRVHRFRLWVTLTLFLPLICSTHQPIRTSVRWPPQGLCPLDTHRLSPHTRFVVLK